MSDLSMFCWNIGIVKVKPIDALVFSLPASIREPSEYSVEAVISKVGLLEPFSFERSNSLILILFWAIKILKLFL